ncbi:unnamed protein product [Symbiodinium microadriaticum]|nr:unnamed protein product [Symbiodinium microadriaticum]
MTRSGGRGPTSSTSAGWREDQVIIVCRLDRHESFLQYCYEGAWMQLKRTGHTEAGFSFGSFRDLDHLQGMTKAACMEGFLAVLGGLSGRALAVHLSAHVGCGLGLGLVPTEAELLGIQKLPTGQAWQAVPTRLEVTYANPLDKIKARRRRFDAGDLRGDARIFGLSRWRMQQSRIWPATKVQALREQSGRAAALLTESNEARVHSEATQPDPQRFATYLITTCLQAQLYACKPHLCLVFCGDLLAYLARAPAADAWTLGPHGGQRAAEAPERGMPREARHEVEVADAWEDTQAMVWNRAHVILCHSRRLPATKPGWSSA